ncbi:retrovirus-related pol polyprotein from transposon TNT 1-94 [Tanacetum coccineum]
MKIEESLNVTFDETPPPYKTSPLLDDDLDEEEAIKVTKKRNLKNDIEDETLVIDEIVNIKESKNHPLENVIGNLNQRTLRSQAQNQSNFFCFISTIEPKNVNEALTDESWILAMQEELNQFIVNNVWELVAQGYNQQKGIDYDETYTTHARLKSIRILLTYACALDFKLFQMDVKSAFLNSFINEENKSFSLTVEEFGHILKIPFEGYVSYTDMWSLDYLAISTPSKGRYKTIPPYLRVIKSVIQTPLQGQVTHSKKKKTIMVNENEILTREVQTHMKSWVEIIRENVFCLGGHRDQVPVCLFHMLYCIETSTKYNLEFFILKRMEGIRNNPKVILSYGMLLTRLFNHASPRYSTATSCMIESCIPSLLIMSERRYRIMAQKDVVTQILALPSSLLITHLHLIT